MADVTGEDGRWHRGRWYGMIEEPLAEAPGPTAEAPRPIVGPDGQHPFLPAPLLMLLDTVTSTTVLTTSEGAIDDGDDDLLLAMII